MTGGEAYVLDREDDLASRLNDELVTAYAPDAAALTELRLLLERHVRHTASSRGEVLLEGWPTESQRFVRIAPRSEVVERASLAEDMSEGAA
jgi:glutamate synthase domain-containing protein 3